MNNVLKVDVIREILLIEEDMLDTVRRMSNLRSFSDINIYTKEFKKLKLLSKKEEYLISQIPKDVKLLGVIEALLHDSSQFNFRNQKNSEQVMVRFVSVLNDIYFASMPKYEVVSVGDYEYVDDDNSYNLMKHIIRTNFLAEYLKSFNNLIGQNDDKVSNLFSKVRYINVFWSKSLFDLWALNDFNFETVPHLSDEELRLELKLSKEDYVGLKNEVLYEYISELVVIMFSVKKSPKKNLVVQDAFFNFRFLIKKLELDDLIEIREGFSDINSKKELINDVLEALDNEITKKTEEADEVTNVSVDDYDKLVNLVKLEDIILDEFTKIDFDSDTNDISLLSSLIRYEKELVSEIHYFSEINSTLNNIFDVWHYLYEKDDAKKALIFQRLSNMLPGYKDFRILPTQKISSYDYIYGNHLIRSFKFFHNQMEDITDEKIKTGFDYFYKFSFFVMPSLTDELVNVDGNHLTISDLSDEEIKDKIGLDDSEYNYDKNKQLYSLGCKYLDSLFAKEKYIDTLNDYVNFQYEMVSLIDVINNLDSENVYKLYNYLNKNSSFFSPLRRDLRKLFKEIMSNEVTKFEVVPEKRLT